METERTFNDYFLPGYVEEALDRAGKLRVETVSFKPGVAVEHLPVDREVLRIAARELRRRRHSLDGLVRDRDKFAGLVALAAEVGRADSPLRREALEILPAITGFSTQMINILLDSLVAYFAEGDDGTSLELPPNRAARGFVETAHGYARYYPGPLGISFPGLLSAGRRLGQSAITPLPLTGVPQVVSNIAAGNVPGISLIEATLAVMSGAASLGKNASSEPFFGPRFLNELASLEGRKELFPISDLVALVTFPSSDRECLQELIHQGDHLQVTGGLDSKRDLGRTVRRLRPKGLRDLKRRVSGHWHKVSFDVVGNEFLGSPWIGPVAFNVAFDNSMFDTYGCLSAQQVFVEGSESEVLQFAEEVCTQMRSIMQSLPKGEPSLERLREMYGWYEGRQDCMILTTLRDIPEYPFLVIYDRSPQSFAVHNALSRSIVIRRVDRLEKELPRILGHEPDLLQSCGAAISQDRLLRIADILGRAGVNRIVAAGDIWNMRMMGDSWDGYLPPCDLVAPQLGYWTTIRPRDIESVLGAISERNQGLLKGCLGQR